jgi:isoleucyl-tRNA synthetase
VEKLDAYWTLYECLVTTAKVVAPFVPFLAETLWQNLAGVFRTVAGVSDPGSGLKEASYSVAESVHLCDYPAADVSVVDEALSARMNLVREIASLGRNARSAAGLKVRQPLAKVEVVLADDAQQEWLEAHASLIADELNVKAVAFTTHGEEYISYSVVPNFKRLGPRLGKNMPAAKKLLGEIDAAKLLAELKSAGKTTLRFPDGASIDLDNDDIEVRLQAKPGWAAAQGKGCVVVLDTKIEPDLVREGVARTIVRIANDMRKLEGFRHEDRLKLLYIASDSDEIRASAEQYSDYICGEVLADALQTGSMEQYAGRFREEAKQKTDSGIPLTIEYKIENEAIAVFFDQ